MRAVLTGLVIGALLTPSNVYSGLKIGWTFNVSVPAGLIAFAFWTAAERISATPRWDIGENNINQTAASAAATIISAGLAAPIPALTLLTGQTLSFYVLSLWLFVVSLLGIVVAAGLRNQLLLRERLQFPAGVVTAETMQDIHKGGSEAHARLRLLGLAAAVSAALKYVVMRFAIVPLAPGLQGAVTTEGGKTIGISATNLGLALDPSLLMVGFGAIAGLRVGISILIGAVLAWGVLAPYALSQGWAHAGAADSNAVWFGPLVEWLLWPGATLMVASSLTSFLVSMLVMALRRRGRRRSGAASLEDVATFADNGISTQTLLAAFLFAMVLLVAAQTAIFSIGFFEAVLAVLLSYVLAIVAARVSGETAITPIGALGKITQVAFSAISPGNTTVNLMTANVTGGAAGHCADLMDDLRTGQIIGATASFQIIAQVFGVLVGALVAALTYLLLIPDPQAQLITPEWPAPAVATWKAVAEVLGKGIGALPPGAAMAIGVAAVAGVVLGLMEALAPAGWRRFIPSASAIGLGFVIPAWNAFSLFLGAAAAAAVAWANPEWAKQRVVVIAAGFIVGESIAGVIGAIAGMAG